MDTLNADYLYQQLNDETVDSNCDLSIDTFIPKFCGRQLTFVHQDDNSEHDGNTILSYKDLTESQSIRMSSNFPTMSRFTSLLSQSFIDDENEKQCEQLTALADEHGISQETIDQCGKKLTVHHFVQVKAMFDYIDQDSSGSISVDEIREIFHRIGHDADFDKEEFLNEIDKDGDGEISFSEFLIMMSGSLSLQFERRDIKKAFQSFANVEDPNKVDVKRMRDILKRTHCILNLDNKVQHDEIDKLLKLLPVDKNGCIDVDQFLNDVGLRS